MVVDAPDGSLAPPWRLATGVPVLFWEGAGDEL